MASDARIHVWVMYIFISSIDRVCIANEWWVTGKIMDHEIESREAHIRLAKSKAVKVMEILSTSLPMLVTRFETGLNVRVTHIQCPFHPYQFRRLSGPEVFFLSS